MYLYPSLTLKSNNIVCGRTKFSLGYGFVSQLFKKDYCQFKVQADIYSKKKKKSSSRYIFAIMLT